MFKFPAASFRKTIFFRMVLTYLIVILPIILLGIYLYNWSYNNASQDISRATATQLAYYLEDLNREVEWMELQQFDVLEDSELNKLAITWDTMTNVERKTGMNYLLHRLTSFKNSSAYIKDIYVHIRSIGKSVSALQAVYEFDENRFDRLTASTAGDHQRFVNAQGTLHLIASKHSGRKGEEPLYIVQIELDAAKLQETLRQLNLYEESGSLLLSEATGFAVGSRGDADPILHTMAGMPREERDGLMRLKIDDTHYHVDQAYSDKLEFTVAAYLPEETVKRPLNKFYHWAWLFALASSAAIVAFSYSTYKFIHKPLLLLVQSFRQMEGGTLDIRIEHGPEDEFGYLYHRFNHMLRKLQALIDQDFKQKMMMQKAELKQLQSQINPHFLYNSFFILNSLAKTGDLDRIERFTNMLGEYFRFITRNGEDHVSLAEEVKHSRMYTEIQMLRFSRRIRVQFDDLPEVLERIQVPRLIVQPLIENAYEHSLEKMPEEGFLRITFETEPQEARIVIEDNGDTLSDSELAEQQDRLNRSSDAGYEMTGMTNIHRRLGLTFGEGSGLLLSRSDLNGLKAVIRIRLKGEQAHVQNADRG